MTATRNPRRGVAAIWALTVLSVFGLLAAAAAGQFATVRTTLEARERQVQALWLARSGVELAAAKITGGAEPNGTAAAKPFPGGELRVAWAKAANGYRIESEGRLIPAGRVSSPTVRMVAVTFAEK